MTTPPIAPQSLHHARRWYGILFLNVSLLMISLDNTIMNVALPTLARRFAASATELQWMVDAYILVFASLLLSMGAIGDRIGRKKALRLGLILFTAGSLITAHAPFIAALIAARAFLGVGAALIMPASLSCIMATFSDPQERAKAIALWAATFGLGVALGPVLGGALLAHFDWSAAFYINLPVGIVAFIGAGKYITESRDSQDRPIDPLGLVLSTIGMLCLVYAVIQAGVAGWGNHGVLISFGAAAILLAVFLLMQVRSPRAMLPLALFKNRSFSGANFALVCIFFANYGSVFLLSQYFQSVQGNTPLYTGVMLLPMALLASVGSGMSARLGRRMGGRRLITSGMLLAAAGLLLAAIFVSPETSYAILCPILSLFAFGIGLAIPAATNSVMDSVPLDKVGIGSAMNDTTRQVGGALGVAVLGSLMNSRYLSGVAELLVDDRLKPDLIRAIRAGIQGAHQAVAQPGGDVLGQQILVITNRAFTHGMSTAMAAGSALLIGAALLVYRIARQGEVPPSQGG